MKGKIFNFKFLTTNYGFTLVELLVVMAILGILTVITLGNFRSSQIKARDAQRKSDLRQIANAMEAYFNDNVRYPAASNGKIKACGCGDGDLTCNWDDDAGQREFCDENNTVYMSKVPGDPVNEPNYFYRSNGAYFQIYAILENNNDPEASLSIPLGDENYNFGVASPNCKPGEIDPETNCL